MADNIVKTPKLSLSGLFGSTRKRKKKNQSLNESKCDKSAINVNVQEVELCLNEHLTLFKDSLLSDITTLINGKLALIEQKLDIKLETCKKECRDMVKSDMQKYKSEIKEDIKKELLAELDTNTGKVNSSPLENPDVCVIASNVKEFANEVPLNTANKLIMEMGLDISSNVQVVCATRLNNHNPSKPALLKLAVSNLDQKKTVLRGKVNLASSRSFKNVFIRSSKSHAERINEVNTRTIISQFEWGRNYRITNNGRLVENNRQQERYRYNGLDRPLQIQSMHEFPQLPHTSTPANNYMYPPGYQTMASIHELPPPPPTWDTQDVRARETFNPVIQDLPTNSTTGDNSYHTSV